MDRFVARRVIRKATRLIIPKLEQGFGIEACKEANMLTSVKAVLFAMRCRPGNPNYDSKEQYIPNIIPFDLFETAMKTLPDKMLRTGIIMGMRDCDYE